MQQRNFVNLCLFPQFQLLEIIGFIKTLFMLNFILNFWLCGVILNLIILTKNKDEIIPLTIELIKKEKPDASNSYVDTQCKLCLGILVLLGPLAWFFL